MSVTCLNCEQKFSKYMTQVVDLDTFPSLREKAEKYGYTQIRVCEKCYDLLAADLEPSDTSSYLHPMFRGTETKSQD